MPRCPVCNSPLPPGLDYCPPAEMVTDERGIPAPPFNGCYTIRLEAIWNPTRQAGQRYGRRKRLTDWQRFIAAYGKNCVMSEVGPLPQRDAFNEARRLRRAQGR